MFFQVEFSLVLQTNSHEAVYFLHEFGSITVYITPNWASILFACHQTKLELLCNSKLIIPSHKPQTSPT